MKRLKTAICDGKSPVKKTKPLSKNIKAKAPVAKPTILKIDWDRKNVKSKSTITPDQIKTLWTKTAKSMKATNIPTIDFKMYENTIRFVDYPGSNTPRFKTIDDPIIIESVKVLVGTFTPPGSKYRYDPKSIEGHYQQHLMKTQNIESTWLHILGGATYDKKYDMDATPSDEEN